MERILQFDSNRRSQSRAERPITIGANALALDFVDTKPKLQVVNPIIEFPVSSVISPQSSEVVTSTSAEIFSGSEGWVAPKAGMRAREMQSQGLARKDRNLAEYARTGKYTPDVARSSYNAFMRMAITTEGGNVLNISGATELPQEVDPNSIMERIGRMTAGADLREAARYGRISIMVADVDAIDYAQLFLNFTGATKEVNTEYFPAEKAEVLNKLQDKRARELLADVDRARGVVEGTVAPDIAALGTSAAKKEYFLWTGKREEGKIQGINPDEDWQNVEELIQAPDLVTKALLAHEIDLLKSAQKGKIRIIFIGDNEAYVPRCCGSVSETQQEMQTSTNLELKIQDHSSEVVDVSEHILFQENTFHSSGGRGGGRYDSENCSSCGKGRLQEDGCKCSVAKAA